MAHVENSRFTSILTEFREALLADTNLSAAKFCRERGIETKAFHHWLKRKGMSVRRIKNEALLKLNKISRLPEASPAEIYLNLWTKYKEHLEAGNNITLRSFCILHDVEYRPMEKWMARNNLNVSDLKIRIGQKILSADTIKENGFSPEASKRLSIAVRSYKRRLKSNPNLNMREHCRLESISYAAMQNWLRYIGTSVRQLKQAAIVEDYNPRKRRPVFVQFQPNGGTNSDKLTGVKIQLADGSNILVDECTVISLCSFINKYDSDQRRKERGDV